MSLHASNNALASAFCPYSARGVAAAGPGPQSLHSRRSMLAGQQITALTKINARSSEFEPKYLRTSIALWVDGGSEETQYSVLSTRYSVHSVFSSWTSILNTQEQCLAAVQCVVACCCCCCLFDHLWGGCHFTVSLAVPGPSTAVRITQRTANRRPSLADHG